MELSKANAKQRSLATYHVHHHLDSNLRILVNVVLALQREGFIQFITIQMAFQQCRMVT